VKVGQFGAECCHLTGEILETLQKCLCLGRPCNVRERRLRCGLDDVICTSGCGVQVALRLAGKTGLYVGG
jgi:hypothetical protein